MNYCSNCGTKLQEDFDFCPKCGQSIETTNNKTVGHLEFAENDASIKSDKPVQRKAIYDGELHKCPNCGDLLKSFSSVCPSCGYELRRVDTKSPVEKLAKEIEKATSLEEKTDLITNFYIPNTKEDIFDFFILAVSNLENSAHETDDAWRAKLEQTYHKARLSFGNTPEFDYIETSYNKTIKKIEKESKRRNGILSFLNRNNIPIKSFLLFTIGLIIIIAGIILMGGWIVDESIGAILFLLGIFFCVFALFSGRKRKKK